MRRGVDCQAVRVGELASKSRRRKRQGKRRVERLSQRSQHYDSKRSEREDVEGYARRLSIATYDQGETSETKPPACVFLRGDPPPQSLFKAKQHRLFHLSRPQDEVHPAVGLDDLAHLSNLEPERGVLERLLHLPAREEAEVALGRVRGAVRFSGG